MPLTKKLKAMKNYPDHHFVSKNKPEPRYIGWCILTMFVLAAVICTIVAFVEQPDHQKRAMGLIGEQPVKVSVCPVVIKELIPILKAREGLRLKPYKLGTDPHWYIGYGHQILKTERLPRIDSTQANSILLSDLYKCITECHRVKAPVTQDNIYSIFISGKLGCKVNKRYK